MQGLSNRMCMCFVTLGQTATTVGLGEAILFQNGKRHAACWQSELWEEAWWGWATAQGCTCVGDQQGTTGIAHLGRKKAQDTCNVVCMYTCRGSNSGKGPVDFIRSANEVGPPVQAVACCRSSMSRENCQTDK